VLRAAEPVHRDIEFDRNSQPPHNGLR
jgi:hypothetical protein